MPKAKHSQHGQQKVDRIFARVTPDAKKGLEVQAEQLGISVGELIELIGRNQIRLSLSRRSLGKSSLRS